MKNLFLIFVLSFIVPGLCLADPGGFECTPGMEKQTRPEIKFRGVTCNMTEDQFCDRGCNRVTEHFDVTLTGKVKTTIKCRDRRNVILGNLYVCLMDDEIFTFEWRTFGKWEWTCQHLINKALDKAKK